MSRRTPGARRWTAVALISASLLGAPSFAAGLTPPTLAGGPSGIPDSVEISGTIGVEGGFSESVVVSSDRAATLTLIPSDLQGEAGVQVPAAAVTVDPASLALEPGVRYRLTMSVSGVEVPGTYIGTLDFQFVIAAAPPSPPPTGSPAPAASPAPPPEVVTNSIPLRVSAADRPVLTAVSLGDDARVRRTRCCTHPWFGGLEGWLAEFILSPAERSETLTVVLRNTAASDANLTSYDATAAGKSTQTVLTEEDLVLATPLPTIEGEDASALEIRIPTRSTEADEYETVVDVEVEGATDDVALSFDLVVRDGPLGPALLIVLGIAFASLVQRMTAGGHRLATIAGRIEALKSEISRLNLTPDAKATLVAMVVAAEDPLDRNRLDDAENELTLIEKRIDKLGQLSDFVARHPDSADAVNEIRQLVLQGNDTEAQTKWAALLGSTPIEDAHLRSAAEAEAAARQPEPRNLGRAVGLAAVVVLAVGVLVVAPFFQPVYSEATGDPLRVLATVVLVVAGAYLAVSVLRIWLGPRWGIRVLSLAVTIGLLIALFFLGLHLLYVEEAAEFVRGFFDPVIVFLLWGVGTDLAAERVAPLLPKAA